MSVGLARDHLHEGSVARALTSQASVVAMGCRTSRPISALRHSDDVVGVGGATRALPPPGGASGRRASVMQILAEQDAEVADGILEDVLLQQVADMENQYATPTIALIAHDNMKKLMRQYVKVHLELLKDFRLTGTGTTCAMLRSEGLEPVGSTASGPLGGDQQIGAMIVSGEVSAVFFFRDPFSAHAHIADIEALSRLVDCHQCYYGSNYRSASAILSFMHGNLKRQMSTGVRCSILKPQGTEDVAEVVHAGYKSTRAAALTQSGVYEEEEASV